jgi:hypothetical protein
MFRGQPSEITKTPVDDFDTTLSPSFTHPKTYVDWEELKTKSPSQEAPDDR